MHKKTSREGKTQPRSRNGPRYNRSKQQKIGAGWGTKQKERITEGAKGCLIDVKVVANIENG